MGKKKLEKKKKLDKKTRVLQATLELISEQGFFETPISQIAKRANVAVGTIYLYFPNKKKLINTLYIDIKTNLVQYALKDYLESMTIKESFLIIVHNIADYFIERPMELLFIEQYSNSPLITTDTLYEGMNIFGPVSNLFEKAQEDKLIKEFSLEMMIALANAGTISLVKFYLFSKTKVDKTTLNSGLDAIWDAIKY
ncbi:MAG TPA: TetR/AcrR family transcriptional regulator [Epulopiscium sp.]|nr:TetR/AcrR family transcriptional regulator [Candidatus Epulonipiscium sp.]